jgi:hypothetical protein
LVPFFHKNCTLTANIGFINIGFVGQNDYYMKMTQKGLKVSFTQENFSNTQNS